MCVHSKIYVQSFTCISISDTFIFILVCKVTSRQQTCKSDTDLYADDTEIHFRNNDLSVVEKALQTDVDI